MRHPIRTILIVSLCATALLGATQASAHGDKNRSSMPRAMGQPEAFSVTCAEAKSGSRAAGGVIGAVGGGIAGKALAAAAVQPEGIVLGAVIGAFVGSQIGGSNVTCQADPATQQRYEPQAEQELHPHKGYGPLPQALPAPAARRVVGGDWYQPSPHSYYGRERRGPLYTAPADVPRPAQVPRDSYVGSQPVPMTAPMTGVTHPGSFPPPCMMCTR
ncbi:MAG: hypothetical protein ACK5XZ_07005 [Hyphomonadaceae bacterium]|jgi:uncharacterized protein YcfJ|uniref:hypothetical protein n=1 Tax=Aquidulcibacter sp. TaxID=2052990 RepID=UPI0022C6FC34|nr:hypothetical protein [Aquidulcibacter sp.]MCE2891224.1 hypothetical protein [Hyphomonadaceae bacterium]MCZ8206648.1 hypothetical protein [Aquidulcibacter sp.]